MSPPIHCYSQDCRQLVIKIGAIVLRRGFAR